MPLSAPPLPRPRIIVPADTLARAAAYAADLRTGAAVPGARLSDVLGAADRSLFTPLGLLGHLFDTKPPRIFAESEVVGDGSDWTLDELRLLGDISVAVPVTVFDDGAHTRPTVHEAPFPGTLVFTPGALLLNGAGHVPVDWQEVTDPAGRFDAEGYYALYRRRLLPVLQYVDSLATPARPAFVTVPGLGCGQFAGPFRGTLGAALHRVLQRLLQEHGAGFRHIDAIYFDPYAEGRESRDSVHGVTLITRPLAQGGRGARPQLCRPTEYAVDGDDFSACQLVSVVAWDHVSWPGNDYYAGVRMTDDGVKAAASDAMAVLTGVEGRYDRAAAGYRPPAPYGTWDDVVRDRVHAGALRLWDDRAVWRP